MCARECVFLCLCVSVSVCAHACVNAGLCGIGWLVIWVGWLVGLVGCLVWLVGWVGWLAGRFTVTVTILLDQPGHPDMPLSTIIGNERVQDAHIYSMYVTIYVTPDVSENTSTSA